MEPREESIMGKSTRAACRFKRTAMQARAQSQKYASNMRIAPCQAAC
jgi:hypothetical protein